MKKFIIVAGVAASGKSYIGKEIAKKIENCIYIDKDTQTRDLVDSFLYCLGSDETDRESENYLEKIRPKEYECLIKQGIENIELNKSCVLSAPFIKEINDNEYFTNLIDNLEFEDAQLKLVWVTTDEHSARKRIIYRNAKRDKNKINNWSIYINNVDHTFIPSLDFEVFTIQNTINPNEHISVQIENAINYIKKD